MAINLEKSVDNPRFPGGAPEEDNDEEPQEMVHKLQRAVQYASRQKLQQEIMARDHHNNVEAHHNNVVIDAREQRSQIAIIQMAPPAQSSSRSVVPASKGHDTATAIPCEDGAGPSLQGPRRSVANRGGGGGTRRQEGAGSSKKKRHHCSVRGCTYNTPHTKDLARHMRKHTGEKPHNCDRCSKSFTRYDKLVLHIRTHEGYRPFACHICSHAATDSSSLKKHLRTHSDERPYKCQLCPYSSKDSSQLVVHLRHHTGDSPYTCTFTGCEAAFKTPSDLSRHTRLHTGEKPYKCSYCDYRAAVKCNLNAHMKRHTNPPAQKKGKAKTVPHVNIEEEDCTEDDETDSNLGNVLPFQYACKLCDFKADTIDHFGVHMKEIHPNSNLGKSAKKVSGKSRTPRHPKTFSEQRNFQCSRCNASFVCEESLRCHMRQHVTVPNRPANVAPEIYGPPRIPVVQQTSNTNAINYSNYPDASGERGHSSDYSLHEMQRVPLVHSVITENPAVINHLPSSHCQQHLHFEHASIDQPMYLVTYNNTDSVNTYRAHNQYHHQLHDPNE